MGNIFDWSAILSIVGVLVVLTNIITQVLKKFTWDKLPTNILAVVISMALTMVAFFAYCQIQDISVVWYAVAAAVVLGFLVAYAAMFGFDKLKETIVRLEGETTTVASVSAAEEVVDGTKIEALSELIGMTVSELKETAKTYGVSTDGLTTKKEIAEAIMVAILTKA